MRRFIATLAVAALVAVLPAAPALAEGAIIGEGGNCSGRVPDVNGLLTGAFVQGEYKSRTTKSGITNFTCHFDLSDDVAPAKSVKARDFLCVTPAGETNDSRIQASPGGRMVLTCNVRPN
jgi:hypothetical protein